MITIAVIIFAIMRSIFKSSKCKSSSHNWKSIDETDSGAGSDSSSSHNCKSIDETDSGTESDFCSSNSNSGPYVEGILYYQIQEQWDALRKIEEIQSLPKRVIQSLGVFSDESKRKKIFDRESSPNGSACTSKCSNTAKSSLLIPVSECKDSSPLYSSPPQSPSPVESCNHSNSLSFSNEENSDKTEDPEVRKLKKLEIFKRTKELLTIFNSESDNKMDYASLEDDLANSLVEEDEELNIDKTFEQYFAAGTNIKEKSYILYKIKKNLNLELFFKLLKLSIDFKAPEILDVLMSYLLENFNDIALSENFKEFVLADPAAFSLVFVKFEEKQKLALALRNKVP